MRNAMLLVAMAALLVSSSLAASSSNLVTSYDVFGNWLPVIFIGVTLVVLISVIHYGIGYLLNNARVKATAVTEMQQAIGSVLLVVVLVGIFYMVGTGQGVSFSTILGSNGQNQIQNICNYLQNSPLNIANSNLVDSNTNLPEPTTAVCQYLIDNGGGNPTTNIDYGLAATYVIMANMTNQSVYEVNAIYNFESVIFFLRNINPFIVVCAPADCDVPFLGTFSAETKIAWKPYQGYVLHRTIMPTVLTEGTLSIYMYVMQDLLLLFAIISWPYLLVAGVLFRTFSFTRRAGGLILAATVVVVLIYPTVNLIEYNSLNNLGATEAIGISQVPGMALCGFGPMSSTGALGSPVGQTNPDMLYCYTSAKSLPSKYIYMNLPEPAHTPTTINECSPVSSYYQYYQQQSASSGMNENPFNLAPPCYVAEPLSFYSLPRAGDIISLYSCTPAASGTIFTVYSQIITDSIIGTATLPIGIILSLFTSTYSPLNSLSSPVNFLNSANPFQGTCFTKIGPQYIMAALEGMANTYGIISVTAFILPIINALLMISAITGLSTMLGGEGTIIGLSRFI